MSRTQEMEEPYAGLRADQLVLRDRLAGDRTVLANERTLLAYVRTGLSLLVAGVSFLQFFTSHAVQVLGWALLPSAAVTLIVGIARYVRVAGSLRNCATRAAQEARPHEGEPR